MKDGMYAAMVSGGLLYTRARKSTITVQSQYNHSRLGGYGSARESSTCLTRRMSSDGFEVTGAQLLALLDDAAVLPPRAELLRLVDTWAEEYDRGEKLDAEDGCNLMHIVGAALCVLLHRGDRAEEPESESAFDLRAALGPAAARVLLCEKPLAELDIEELHALVTALQLEFAGLYTLDGGGYGALVDVELICVRVLARLGALLAVREQLQTDPKEPPPAAVRGLLDVDEDGYCSVRAETLVYLLDALHSMLCLHTLLTRAEMLPPAEPVELHAHHREASNETFFTHSMTSDCLVGTIAQYAHRFAHLFHSVSQAVYYNFPSYARQAQLPLAALQRPAAPAVNVLPLLTELRPDVPVLFEHTGAGCRAQHAKHPWSWVLWSRFVLLVDADMRSFVAADVRTLLVHAM
jgi:hypothetical protein